jgi:hypothetical protein
MHRMFLANTTKFISNVMRPGLSVGALALGLLAAGPNASTALAASRALCTATADKKWSVPAGCLNARVTITHDNVTIDAAPLGSSKAGGFMALTILQDAKGHPVVWGKHVRVDPTTSSSSTDPVPPPSYPDAQETYFLVWQPAPASVWKIVARSRNRAESGATTQGNNEQLGFGNGNINVTNKPAICRPNHWTQYMSDNGGFIGRGVRDYLYNVAGETTICNSNSQTAYYSIVCSVGGWLGRVDGDHEIDGNQCIHVPYEAVLPTDTHNFLSFLCFINPTDPLLVWYTKNHSVELPLD